MFAFFTSISRGLIVWPVAAATCRRDFIPSPIKDAANRAHSADKDAANRAHSADLGKNRAVLVRSSGGLPTGSIFV